MSAPRLSAFASPPERRQRTAATLAFAWRKQRLPMAAMLLVAGLFIVAIARGAVLGVREDQILAWWGRVDPVLTMATLVAAVTIWLLEVRMEWERSLPQLLSVEFWHPDHGVVLSCERAPLIDEAPRAFAQQLGMQMNGGAHLKFWPVPALPPELHTEYWEGAWVRHHRLRYALQVLPLHAQHWHPGNKFGRAAIAAVVPRREVATEEVR